MANNPEDLVILLKNNNEESWPGQINELWHSLLPVLERHNFTIQTITDRKTATEILKGIDDLLKEHK